jgi:HEAT repeat protein
LKFRKTTAILTCAAALTCWRPDRGRITTVGLQCAAAEEETAEGLAVEARVKAAIEDLDTPRGSTAGNTILRVGPVGIPTLLNSMRIVTQSQKDEILRIVARMGPEAVAKLVEGLQSDNPLVRLAAMDLLREMRKDIRPDNKDGVILALAERLEDSAVDIQRGAAELLPEFRRAAIWPIVIALGSYENPVDFFPRGKLFNFGIPAKTHIVAAAELRTIYHDRDLALGVLAKIGQPVLPELLKGVSKPDLVVKGIRKTMVFGRFSGREDMSRAELMVQIECILTLADMHDLGAIDRFPANEDSRARVSLAKALGKIEHNMEVAPLISLLKVKSGDWRVRMASAKALGKIGDKKAVEPLVRVLSDGDEDAGIRAISAEALGDIGDARAVDPLVGLLSNKQIRKACVEALGNIGDGRAVAPLVELLGERAMWMTTIQALGKIGDRKAVDPLMSLLSDKEADIRAVASEALGKIGDKKAVSALVNMMVNDTVSYVRDSASHALSLIPSSGKQ